MVADPRKTRRLTLLSLAAGLAVVAVVVALVAPWDSRDWQVAEERSVDAPVAVKVVIESFDAAKGTLQLRITTGAGTQPVPAEGVSVLTDLAGVEPLRVAPDALFSGQADAEVQVASGSVTAYPFDKYSVRFVVAAVAGSPTTVADLEQGRSVPVSLQVLSAASGFDVDGDARLQPLSAGAQAIQVDLRVDRSRPATVWATLMMAIYWLLAAAVVGVVVVSVRGARPWETRHLAWLGAMIFAFSSFRAAAPGSPPIGVFFDFAAFFWAELIVAVGLATLVAHYLVGRNVE